MVKATVEVRSGAARFDVALKAQSVEQVLGMARAMYRGPGSVRVKVPTAPDGSFTEDTASTQMAEADLAQRIAA